MRENLDDISVIPYPTRQLLNNRQLEDYRVHRTNMLEWLLHVGKEPDWAEGYAHETTKRDAYRLDKFYRWAWNHRKAGYTTEITHDDADAFVKELAYGDKSNTHKANCVKSLKRLFKWRHHELDGELWDTDKSFSRQPSQPRDYFTQEERRKLREAALEYGSIPGYNDLSPQQRSRWKAYLAQRFDKPKSEVSPDDWKRANGWKTTTLVWTSLDTGLRPIEVERASVRWVDTDNGVLRIPKEDSSKNRDNWKVALQEKTSHFLGKWLEERRHYEKYEGTDKLWLTRFGNSYQSHSLKYVLERLCEEAGISTDNRQISWYAIRHSVGTYMTHVEDLGAAKAQLRHKSEVTTMKYDQAPVEERQDALDKMG